MSLRLRSIIALTACLTLGIMAFSLPSDAKAHCQVPCGIYDDHARVKAMLEDCETVEKAYTMMASLAGKTDAQSQNQMVRWVHNKEKHSQYIIETISNYFLTQRVKSSQKDYTTRLVKHHTVIVNAMKAKQNSEAKFGAELKKSIEALKAYYPAKHSH